MNFVFKKLLKHYLRKIRHGTLYITDDEGEELVFRGSSELNAQIHVKSNLFFKELILYGDIGFGDAYVRGYWETPDINNVFAFLLKNSEHIADVSGTKKQRVSPTNIFKPINRFRYFLERNTPKTAKKNIRRHYDLSNDFFQLFLDKTMTYSSAWFKDNYSDLQEAQENKYDRICKIAGIRKDDHILEIGGGWGGFGLFAAKNYDCKVTSISLSQEQANYSKELIQKNKLSEKFEYLVQDYRAVKGKFDKIVSIEMIEAVGIQYLKNFFRKCNDLLVSEGTLCIQAILCPDSRFGTMKKNVDWLQMNIFPGGALPSVSVLLDNIKKGSDFFLYDFKDLGQDYAKTLSIWHDRFVLNLPKIRELGFDEVFIRKWKYYLKYCEEAFSQRSISVAQLAFSRTNQPVMLSAP